MFSNNALKTYQRLNKVLKKDKTQDEGYLVSENVKWDIEKAIATYMEIQQSSSNVNIQTKNDDGCHVVKDDRRKNLFKKIKAYTSKKSILLAAIGMIALAASVNLVELACSLGFPAVFSEILALNKVSTIKRILYLLLYDLFYMLDDIIIFYIAMFTFNIKAVSNKYTKYSNLVGGIIILLIGLLLLIAPNWIMFNFE